MRPSFQAAAAATYAYAYGRIGKFQIQNLGQSQFIGHSWRTAESSPMEDMDREYYPGLSMMNWTSAMPLARFRVLSMLTSELIPQKTEYIDGGVVLASRLKHGGDVAAFAYRTSYQSQSDHRTSKNVTLLVVNKNPNSTCVALRGHDIVALKLTGSVAVVSFLQADGSPNKVEHHTPTQGTVQFELAGFQVAMVSLNG